MAIPRAVLMECVDSNSRPLRFYLEQTLLREEIDCVPEMMGTVNPPFEWVSKFVEAWSRADRWLRYDVFMDTEALEFGERGRELLGDPVPITNPDVYPQEW